MLPKLPARGVKAEHHMARIDVAMANLSAMVAEPTEEELEEAIAFAAGPEGAAAEAAAQAALASSTTSVNFQTPINLQTSAAQTLAPPRTAPKAPTGASTMAPPRATVGLSAARLRLVCGFICSGLDDGERGGRGGSSDPVDESMVQPSPPRGAAGVAQRCQGWTYSPTSLAAAQPAATPARRSRSTRSTGRRRAAGAARLDAALPAGRSQGIRSTSEGSLTRLGEKAILPQNWKVLLQVHSLKELRPSHSERGYTMSKQRCPLCPLHAKWKFPYIIECTLQLFL